MNALPLQQDGALPLEVWLRSAVSLTQADTKAAVFERALTSLRKASPGETLPVTIVASPPDMPSEVPVYQDERRRILGEQLQALEAARRKLEAQGEDTSSELAKIRELKRLLRRGPEPEAGDFLANGRFQLLSPLGKGGFGVVWKALDMERDMLVAIKLLHGHFANDASRRERFFRGAERMARLEHPHVVRVLLNRGIEPYGEHWTLYYFVMEFLRGGDFKRAILQGSLSVDDRIRVIRETALALEHAHDKGLIHRDISPDNILLDEQGHARLTDFDLVRADDSIGPTATKMAMGKLLFAAPETMQDAAKVDVRADVYGLGMTLAFALHGREMTVESLREWGSFLSGLECSEYIQMVVRKAVATQVGARYPDVRSFHKALGHVPRRSRSRKYTAGRNLFIIKSLTAALNVTALVAALVLVAYSGSFFYEAWSKFWNHPESKPTPVSAEVAQPDGGSLPQNREQSSHERSGGSAIRKLKLWPNGSKLKVSFMDGDPQLHERIQKVASEWTQYANLTFEFTSKPDPDADIRISATQGEEWWSYRGTDARSVPSSEFTMHLGLATGARSVELFSAEILMTFGAALGLENEWTSPNWDARWTREAAYAYVPRLRGLKLQMTKKVVSGLHPPTGPAYHAFDPRSVMFSPVARDLLVDNIETYGRRTLLESDKAFIAKLYPKP
ncbi:protein kinase domain-containing protein [Pyxidicoccus caerfyrddinensis]|uniref:protein kinase domain-containing protein n=1 Tax=Pyxidicoccus caerfyrddinensis TaxID=2709663 RepID=UPI0013DA9DF3|nr:protein kinase [Pyxidicoccus caerfyrddinensis]